MPAIFVDFSTQDSTFVVELDFAGQWLRTIRNACQEQGLTLPPSVPIEMDYFDKRMALDVIEDTLTVLGAPENRGFALGLCGGFYMCGLLSHAEWEALLERIPKNQVPHRVDKARSAHPPI